MMHSEILAEDLEMPDILFQRENSDTFFKKPEKGWKCPMSYFSNSVIAERFEPGGVVIHVAWQPPHQLRPTSLKPIKTLMLIIVSTS
jgi:hypothetical protein